MIVNITLFMYNEIKYNWFMQQCNIKKGKIYEISSKIANKIESIKLKLTWHFCIIKVMLLNINLCWKLLLDFVKHESLLTTFNYNSN